MKRVIRAITTFSSVITGNLRVYFTIYETETFPRFAIPALSTASPLVTATLAAVTTPAQGPTATTTTSTATSNAAAPSSPQPSGNAVSSGMFEVHDRYRATMVAAFAFSPGLTETSIKTNTITTGMATGSTTQNPIPCNTTTPCTQVTFAPGPSHSSVIVGLSYHPWGYDTFPGAYSWKKPRQAVKQGFGIFGGLSVQNLNDYYAGADFQIAHGLQIIGGVNFYRQDTFAHGFTSGDIYAGTPDFTGPQRWTRGGFFGIGLNLPIFRKAFGSVTELGTKAPTSGT